MPSIFNQAIFPSVILFKCRDLLQNEISVKEAKITKIDMITKRRDFICILVLSKQSFYTSVIKAG